MYSPRGRTGRTPGGVKPIVAAVAIALMGMGGVALADPKADPGPPEQAQGNGPPPQGNAPPPQAQAGGQPPQAQDPAPPPQAKAKGQQGAGRPAEVPPAQPPQAGGQGNPGSGSGQSGRVGPGHHGRPSPGESRGQGRSHSGRGKSGVCHGAACRGGAPKPSAGASGDEQPQPAGGQPGPVEGGVLGVAEERPDDDQGGSAPDERQAGGAPELVSVLGLDQGGGEEAGAAPGSFDGALPFTGFELALLAGIGALLLLAGVRLRRSTA
jgi:hypothetical protein